MPQLEQTEFFLSQLFWLVILFVTLFLVLTYFTLPKIRAFLNKRDSFVKEHLSKQDALLKKAELLIEEYEVKISEANTEANKIIENARNNALIESEELIKIAENRIQEQIKITEEKVLKEKKLALEELDKEIKDSASMFISKITDQPIEGIKL
jgi:F-type H+-transporting ATPase subunit b